MIDLHTHLLYETDDGTETIEETIERLTKEMMQYARKYEFEKAATIRDFIEELKNMK